MKHINEIIRDKLKDAEKSGSIKHRINKIHKIINMGESDGWTSDSISVKATEANICINDLREEEKMGTYKVINTKKFYNEFELLEKIKELVKKEGNDQELGSVVRKLITKEI